MTKRDARLYVLNAVVLQLTTETLEIGQHQEDPTVRQEFKKFIESIERRLDRFRDAPKKPRREHG